MAAMTASLEWLLAQHDLGLRLVAGVPGCEQLTWAHASDLVDPTPWLTGGELVLTTGIGLPRAAGEQHAYVGRLADAGVAGLGFGVGVRYAAIPAPIVAACERCPPHRIPRVPRLDLALRRLLEFDGREPECVPDEPFSNLLPNKRATVCFVGPTAYNVPGIDSNHHVGLRGGRN